MTPPTETEAPLMRLRGVGRSYDKGTRVFTALRGVDLDIRPGEFVCLLGPSGCGKSTLLRILAGLDIATEGSVLRHGEPLRGVNPGTMIVFQTFALFPWLSVSENVELALKARGVPADGRAARAGKLIDSVGLDGFESAYPRELSGGMRQKVGFARAMAMEPELLCLDEPFSALDVLSAEGLRGELMELWLAKSLPTKAVLMVTHNIEEAVAMADRIIVMARDPGRVIAEIPVRLAHPRRPKSAEFQELADEVYGAITGRLAEPAALVPVFTLPQLRTNAVAGLLEKLAGEGGIAELHRIGAELHLELDDLLPIIESAELLGFISVIDADLHLTPLGRNYADADILGRKEVLAARILRLPIFARVLMGLRGKPERRAGLEELASWLEPDIARDDAAMIDNIINWGRSAEIFDYDDDAEEIYLENA